LRTIHPDSKVIGISLKDRSAILPAGHMANAAYWFDPRSGQFVSSTYYFAELPGWVRDFNANRPSQRFRGAQWLNHKMPDEVGPKLYAGIPASPFGNELNEEMVENAISAERLGQRNAIDLLTISFSSNDYVGHTWGPDSQEVREISIRTDTVLAKLFRFLDAQVGMADVLVVLTADHGVSPTPEALPCLCVAKT
jgi:predicted AlkP superfamily pyrophosphatase or phosphodiesterase